MFAWAGSFNRTSLRCTGEMIKINDRQVLVVIAGYYRLTDERGDWGLPTKIAKACDASGVLERKERATEEKKELIINVYQERCSMRGIERTFGVSRRTLSA